MAQHANNLTSRDRAAAANLANAIAALLESGSYRPDARSALYDALQLLDYLIAVDDSPIPANLIERAYKAACEAMDIASDEETVQ